MLVLLKLDCPNRIHNAWRNVTLSFLQHTTGSSSSGNVASTLGLTFAVVRECALAVHERLYPDETGQMVQKWKLNKTTQKLVFSQRWVLGLLERYQKQLAGSDGSSGAGALYDSMVAGDEGDDSSSSDDGSDEE